jgi:hypothetical protein
MTRNLILIFICLAVTISWGRPAKKSSDETLSVKQQQEIQRLDEYANSIRRRDYLKDRLIFEVGLGSKFPVMGASGFPYGVGVEYITRWHIAPFVSYGIIPSKPDESFEELTLEGGSAYKVGLSYYLFPKSPLHLGLSVSYGAVFYDHEDVLNDDRLRPIIINEGVQGDVSLTYLTDAWYFLTVNVGLSHALENNSFGINDRGEEASKVISKDGIPDNNLVFGIAIGFALSDLYPDVTEQERRKREHLRSTGKL